MEMRRKALFNVRFGVPWQAATVSGPNLKSVIYNCREQNFFKHICSKSRDNLIQGTEVGWCREWDGGCSEDAGTIQSFTVPPPSFHRICRTSLSFRPNRVLYLSKRHSRDLMYISWYRATISSVGSSTLGTVIGSPTITGHEIIKIMDHLCDVIEEVWHFHITWICNSLNYTNQIHANKLAYGGDGLAIRHNAPGVPKEKATAMENTRRKA